MSCPQMLKLLVSCHRYPAVIGAMAQRCYSYCVMAQRFCRYCVLAQRCCSYCVMAQRCCSYCVMAQRCCSHWWHGTEMLQPLVAWHRDAAAISGMEQAESGRSALEFQSSAVAQEAAECRQRKHVCTTQAI